MPSQIVQFDQLRSLANADITTSYVAVGTAFAYPMRLVKFLNNTNADVVVSLDGVNDYDYVPATSFALYDFTSNKSLPGTMFNLEAGTQIYVKSSGSPSSGSFYVVAIYGRGD